MKFGIDPFARSPIANQNIENEKQEHQVNDVLNREEITGYTCKAGYNVFPAKIKGRIKSEHLHTIIMMMKIRGRGANRKDKYLCNFTKNYLMEITKQDNDFILITFPVMRINFLELNENPEPLQVSEIAIENVSSLFLNCFHITKLN